MRILERYCLAAGWFMLLMLATVGCGDRLALHPVTGHVTGPDGQPLAEARVTFEHDDLPISSTAVTDEQGSFKLGTYEAGDGAPAGEYRVAVAESRGDIDHPEPPTISPDYGRFDTSGLQFTVESGRNKIPIELSRRP